jgi:protein-L-isoaspartate(D-aspartate) O-methyltransferase
MADIALQRKNMVESQIRPSDVTDRRITSAMLDTPREAFLPEAVKPLAYMDEALEVAPGRWLMAPRVFARLLQLAAIEATDKVLDVGALGGYSSAILSRIAREVIALESDAALASAAKAALAATKTAHVTVVAGELTAGHRPGSAYDVIIIEGAVEAVPQALIDQLAEGGRLAAIDASSPAPRAILLIKGAAGIARRVGFDAAAPRLAAFDKPKAFVF